MCSLFASHFFGSVKGISKALLRLPYFSDFDKDMMITIMGLWAQAGVSSIMIKVVSRSITDKPVHGLFPFPPFVDGKAVIVVYPECFSCLGVFFFFFFFSLSLSLLLLLFLFDLFFFLFSLFGGTWLL